MTMKTATTAALLACLFVGAPAAMAQTYSKTFTIKGLQEGTFRVKAYIRRGKGAARKAVPMIGAKEKTASKESSEKQETEVRQSD